MLFQFMQNLFDNFGKYSKDEQYSTNTDYDVILHIGEEPNYKKFYAHSIILKINSKYFESALSCRWVKKDDDYFILRKRNISPKIFEIILKYIYTGTISSDRSILLFDILLAADELCVDGLVDYIQDLLTNSTNCKDFFLDNLLIIYHITNQFPHFQILQRHTKMLIGKYPTQIFNSHYFLELPENILLSCLESDRLHFYEVEIWNRVLDWGIKQIPRNLDKFKVESWTIEDFIELEEILRNCIPLIRFRHIKSNDFYNVVMPFRPIIPVSTFNDILKCEVLPIPPRSIRRPVENKDTLLNAIKSTIIFYNVCESFGHFRSRGFHGLPELLACTLINILVAIFAIYIFMWFIISFFIKITIRKFVDYMNFENRIFLLYK